MCVVFMHSCNIKNVRLVRGVAVGHMEKGKVRGFSHISDLTELEIYVV